MDHARGHRGLVARMNGPRAGFLLARGQISPQTQQIVSLFDQGSRSGLLHAQVLQILGALVGRQRYQFGFNLGGHHHGPRAVMLGGILAHFGNPGIRIRIGQFLLGDVAREERGFRRQQEKLLQQSSLFGRHFQAVGELAAAQMRFQAVGQIDLRLGLLVAALRGLLLLVAALLHALQIRQNQFRVDDLDVADGVHRIHHMLDVGVLKTPHHLDDRVHLADMGQELVPQPLPRAGPFHQAGDVDEFENGRHHFLRPANFCKDRQAIVRHRDDSLIGLDGAETVIRGESLASLRDRVEKRAFADVRQTDYTCAEHESLV